MQLKLTRLGAALSLLALLIGVGVAQAQTSSTTTSAVTGTVVSVDPPAQSVVIKTDAGSTETYLLSDPAWIRSAGRDIELTDLKVGDRVRIELTPGAGTDEPSRTASRLEVLGAGTQSSSPQRTVSTERPVLGESADAGGDRPSMPSTAGSTTGRSVSTDRPVLGQSPTSSSTSSTTSTTTPSPSTTTTVPPSTSSTSTYGSTSSTPPSSATSSADVDAETDREDELPATAGPLPLMGAMGLLALLAGLAVRAARKQHP